MSVRITDKLAKIRRNAERRQKTLQLLAAGSPEVTAEDHQRLEKEAQRLWAEYRSLKAEQLYPARPDLMPPSPTENIEMPKIPKASRKTWGFKYRR